MGKDNQSEPENKDLAGNQPGTKDLSDKEVIEVDGEKLTIEQLKQGYMRNKDYTQSKQSLAQQRKELESQQEEIEIVKPLAEFLAQNPDRVEEIRRIIAGEEPAGSGVEEDIFKESPMIKKIFNKIDELEKEINSSKEEKEIEKMAKENELLLSELSKKYPSMNPDEVIAHMVLNPDDDVEEVAKESHEKQEKRVQETISKLKEKKPPIGGASASYLPQGQKLVLGKNTGQAAAEVLEHLTEK